MNSYSFGDETLFYLNSIFTYYVHILIALHQNYIHRKDFFKLFPNAMHHTCLMLLRKKAPDSKVSKHKQSLVFSCVITHSILMESKIFMLIS